MSDPVVELAAVDKAYASDGIRTQILHAIDLTIQPGEFAALVGRSGSGKSTLLNIIGLLETPSAGQLRIAGHAIARASAAELTRIRGENIGFVFQFHHLISALTAAENLMMPLVIAQGRLRPAMRERALAALASVGLERRADARPNQLSGGEQQRVAVARALMRNPALVLADEPTGNLDTQSSDAVFALLREHNQRTGAAFVIVTHDPRLAERCDRIIRLTDGRIEQS